MVSTFTANKNLEQPGRGDQVGTWDTPVNNNMSIIDDSFGGTATIALTNSNVTLSAAQYECAMIVFTGTITANIAITFPYVGSLYTIENRTAGAFSITLQTTNASAEIIACPPYEPFDILTRASTAGVRYRNLGKVGSYLDYGGSSVPLWVSACTIPPYLNCDGTSFSSATYPALATIFGGTTLPDARGRYRAALNQGQSRITSGTSTGGVDGNTLFASGGAQTTTLSSQNVPPVPITDPGHLHTASQPAGATGNVAQTGTLAFTIQNTGSAFTGITAGSTSPTNFSNLPPSYVGGLTLVRAA